MKVKKRIPAHNFSALYFEKIHVDFLAKSQNNTGMWKKNEVRSHLEDLWGECLFLLAGLCKNRHEARFGYETQLVRARAEKRFCDSPKQLWCAGVFHVQVLLEVCLYGCQSIKTRHSTLCIKEFKPGKLWELFRLILRAVMPKVTTWV